MKYKSVGRGICKHPHGRGKSSFEFSFDNTKYYFCCGWCDDFGEGLSVKCKNCIAHVSNADSVLLMLKEGKEDNVK